MQPRKRRYTTHRVTFAADAKAHDGLQPHVAAYDEMVYKYLHGALFLRHPSDVLLVIERQFPEDAAPQTVFHALLSVLALVDDLVHRVSALASPASSPVVVQTRDDRRTSRALAPPPPLVVNEEPADDVDVTGGVDDDDGAVDMATILRTPCTPSQDCTGHAGSLNHARTTAVCTSEDDDGTEEDAEALTPSPPLPVPTQVPILPRGGGYCARVSLAGLPALNLLRKALAGAVDATAALMASQCQDISSSQASGVSSGTPSPLISPRADSFCHADDLTSGNDLLCPLTLALDDGVPLPRAWKRGRCLGSDFAWE